MLVLYQYTLGLSVSLDHEKIPVTFASSRNGNDSGKLHSTMCLFRLITFFPKCYEYVIMFDSEVSWSFRIQARSADCPFKVKYFWSRRISFGGALLFLCRYLPFMSSVVQIYCEYLFLLIHYPIIDAFVQFSLRQLFCTNRYDCECRYICARS